MRTVTLEDTFYFTFPARAFATGVPNALAGTPDLVAIEMDSSLGVIDTGITTAAHGSQTRVNVGTCICTAANGYERGKIYEVYIDAGTSGGTDVVGEKVYEFQVLTAAEEATRGLVNALYPTNGVIVTTASNDTTHINCTEVIDSSATADHMNGEILVVIYVGGTYDGLALFARVTDYVVSGQLATVELINGGALPETIAAGDKVYRFGQYTARNHALENIPSAATILTTEMTEAYAADGVAPTLAQAIFLIQQVLTEFSVSGTTQTAKKLDGTTAAATFTLNDATTPTAITRAI